MPEEITYPDPLPLSRTDDFDHRQHARALNSTAQAAFLPTTEIVESESKVEINGTAGYTTFLTGTFVAPIPCRMSIEGFLEYQFITVGAGNIFTAELVVDTVIVRQAELVAAVGHQAVCPLKGVLDVDAGVHTVLLRGVHSVAVGSHTAVHGKSDRTCIVSRFEHRLYP